MTPNKSYIHYPKQAMLNNFRSNQVEENIKLKHDNMVMKEALVTIRLYATLNNDTKTVLIVNQTLEELDK